MAKVAYYVDDVLGAICETLNLNVFEYIGGHYTFANEAAYDAALNAAYEAIWAMLDDNDPSNNDTANGYLDTLGTANSIVMYWSTEKGGWVN